MPRRIEALELPGSKMAAALCAAWLLVLPGCAREEAVEKVFRPVRYQEVAESGARRVRSFAGVAKAGLESQLSFRVPGTVEQVPVTVGAAVSTGQVLARLDPTDYELMVQEAVAGLAQAEAARRNAEADFDRVRGLYENNNASLRELDGARATAESTLAQVEAAQKRLDQARRQLSYTTLRAPATGRIASVDVEINENVGAGQPVVLLTGGSEIDVEVALPGALISEVEIGQSVSVEFTALPGRVLTAQVTEAGVAAVGAATTFPVTARLDRTDPDIRSGMAAEVEFRFGRAAGPGRMLVPAVSVGEDREGRFVYVLEETGEGTGVVRRRSVTVGDLTADGIELFGGVATGERVVTAGVRRLADGERVKVIEDGS